MRRVGRVRRDRLGLVFDLFDFGVQMKRAALRRNHPRASRAAIERKLAAWLLDRPGAEHGDAVGRVIIPPRPDRTRR